MDEMTLQGKEEVSQNYYFGPFLRCGTKYKDWTNQFFIQGNNCRNL